MLDPRCLVLAGRRRAAGLRREELAGLSGISVDYLTRLEQGQAPHRRHRWWTRSFVPYRFQTPTVTSYTGWPAGACSTGRPTCRSPFTLCSAVGGRISLANIGLRTRKGRPASRGRAHRADMRHPRR
ncbi:helix-turn-helix domain-containing protein [Mycolicibacterium psychrotolerans]|uniref:helix-turn-helix domain-containing protein n=1 Tax=Mycolicibacterium psychrotolerans TaxID=216929 RepID=UPI003D671E6F